MQASHLIYGKNSRAVTPEVCYIRERMPLANRRCLITMASPTKFLTSKRFKYNGKFETRSPDSEFYDLVFLASILRPNYHIGHVD
jgi:hypothetical protein